MCFSGDCQVNARNGSCVTTIVCYRGNLVYRVVASIPLWVTCGRFPREAPTHLCLGLPSGLLPSGFPTNNLYVFIFSTSSVLSSVWGMNVQNGYMTPATS
jgi:hypothetical protein